VPFFKQYPLRGSKSLDYLDFCKGVVLMKNKDHLTEAGLEEMRLIKTGMNKGRDRKT